MCKTKLLRIALFVVLVVALWYTPVPVVIALAVWALWMRGRA